MDPKIKELQERQEAITKRQSDLQALAEAESRSLTEEEGAEFDGLNDEFDQNEKQLERLRKLDENRQRVERQSNRQTQPDAPARDDSEPRSLPRVTGGEPRFAQHGLWGYRNFGQMAQEVRTAAGAGNQISDRLRWANRAALSTFGSEGSAADGGFAVPPDVRSEIMSMVTGEDSLLARTDQQTSSSNSLTFPTDETTPWQTTGGILCNWEGEGDAMAQSKPNLQQTTIRLHKLTSLVPVTDELLEDAPALSNYLRRKVSEKMAFKLNLSILQGTGAGQPLGLLNSPCLVSVAKETSQVADTIVAENIMKMWSRMYGPSRARAVWLINQDVEPSLFTMVVKVLNVAGNENVGGAPVYMPANGLAGSPFGTLFGRPVIPTQACETVGDKGDIFFADLTQYLTAIKVGGVREDVSIHFWFDQGTTAFRFVMRVAGHPWWSSSISVRDGSNNLSPFVTLDARA